MLSRPGTARNEERIEIVYRGWRVLGGLFLVYAASNGILMHTLPLVYPALMAEFGWSEAQVTLPATVLFVVAAVSSPPVGALLDRYSAPLIIGIGSVGMVAGLAALAHVDELWQMTAVYVLFALVLTSCGIVPTMLVLTRWFRRLRGRATGLLLLASSLGASVFPLLLGTGMQSFGWRGALFMFAAIAAAIAILPSVLLIRDRPAASEMAVEFATDAVAGSPRVGHGADAPTLRAAAREPRFYVIALATGSVWFTVLALLQHQSIFLARDVGIESATLPAIFSTFFAFSVIGKLGFGWLADRLDKAVTLAASIGVLICGLFVLLAVPRYGTPVAFAYAAVAGIGFSGAFTMIQLWIASFYAGPSYGRILAVLTLFDTLSGALGTWVAGQMRTTIGSYLPVIGMMIGLCAIAIACVVGLHRRHSHQPMTSAPLQR